LEKVKYINAKKKKFDEDKRDVKLPETKKKKEL